MVQNSQSPIPQLFLSGLAGLPAVLHQLWVHPTRGPIIHTELDVIYLALQKHYKFPHSMSAHDADLTEATNCLFLHSTNITPSSEHLGCVYDTALITQAAPFSFLHYFFCWLAAICSVSCCLAPCPKQCFSPRQQLCPLQCHVQTLTVSLCSHNAKYQAKILPQPWGISMF